MDVDEYSISPILIHLRTDSCFLSSTHDSRNPYQYILSASSARVGLKNIYQSQGFFQANNSLPVHYTDDTGLVYVLNLLGVNAYRDECIIILSVYAGPYMEDGPTRVYGTVLWNKESDTFQSKNLNK